MSLDVSTNVERSRYDVGMASMLAMELQSLAKFAAFRRWQLMDEETQLVPRALNGCLCAVCLRE